MPVENKCLCIAKEVASSTTDSETFVIPNGNIFHVIRFSGHAAYSVNSVVKAVWDLDGTPEVIWSTKGDVNSEDIEFTRTGDGIKKLAICLENGESGALVMSGKIDFVEHS